MKIIGERISVLKKDNLLSIVILPTTDKKKLALLFLWLMAWTVCGIIVLANYPRLTDQSSKLFVIVYLSFWLYFEYSITKAFIWKKFGREKLWIQDGQIHYQREVNKRGKVMSANLDLVSKLSLIDLSRTSLADTINQSFWVKGGERLQFTVQGKVYRCGMQLSDEEARTVLREMNSFIPD